MKPDWSSKNVPAWAEWAAQEPSGSWYWYSHRPTYSELCTEWQTKGQREIIPKVELRAQDTLERRPQTFKGIPPKFDNYNVLSRTFEIFYSGDYDQGPFNWIQPNAQQK